MRDHWIYLRRAVVAALRSDAAVATLVGARVYGEQVPVDMPVWPSDANPAYVKVGMPIKGPSNPSGQNGGDISFAIHGFARGPGTDSAEALAGAVVKALDSKTLTLTGSTATLMSLRCTASQTVTDAESSSDFHAIVQFAALTAEPA